MGKIEDLTNRGYGQSREAVGDDAGRRAWVRILAAVDELARTERRRDETLQ